jgi:hypothetical protein
MHLWQCYFDTQQYPPHLHKKMELRAFIIAAATAVAAAEGASTPRPTPATSDIIVSSLDGAVSVGVDRENACLASISVAGHTRAVTGTAGVDGTIVLDQ